MKKLAISCIAILALNIHLVACSPKPVLVTQAPAHETPTQAFSPTPEMSIYPSAPRPINEWLSEFRILMQDDFDWYFEWDISAPIATAESVTDDFLETIIQNAVFLNIDYMSRTCPDTLMISDFIGSGDTEDFLIGYKDFLRELLIPLPGFDLVTITWMDNGCYREFTTVAVVDHNGYYVYEPILDTTIVNILEEGGSPDSSVSWKNILGITKGWAYMWIERKGSNGCTSEFTSYTEMSAAFPFEIEKSGTTNIARYCSPKTGCECRHSGGRKDQMECEEHSQEFVIKGKIGLSYFSATVITDSAILTVSKCAS